MNISNLVKAAVVIASTCATFGAIKYVVLPRRADKRRVKVNQDQKLCQLLDPLLQPLTQIQKNDFWKQPRTEEIIRDWEDGHHTDHSFNEAIQFVIDHYVDLDK